MHLRFLSVLSVLGGEKSGLAASPPSTINPLASRFRVSVMTRPPAKPGRAWFGMPGWLPLMLALGASSLGPWVVLAFGKEDTEALESPLLLAVARQLEEGPAGLYGPYGGGNPLVLIHAPLYYRVAAL